MKFSTQPKYDDLLIKSGVKAKGGTLVQLQDLCSLVREGICYVSPLITLSTKTLMCLPYQSAEYNSVMSPVLGSYLRRLYHYEAAILSCTQCMHFVHTLCAVANEIELMNNHGTYARVSSLK